MSNTFEPTKKESYLMHEIVNGRKISGLLRTQHDISKQECEKIHHELELFIDSANESIEDYVSAFPFGREHLAPKRLIVKTEWINEGYCKSKVYGVDFFPQN